MEKKGNLRIEEINIFDLKKLGKKKDSIYSVKLHKQISPSMASLESIALFS